MRQVACRWAREAAAPSWEDRWTNLRDLSGTVRATARPASRPRAATAPDEIGIAQRWLGGIVVVSRSRYLVGIATDGRRPPRSGCAVIVGDDTVGEVTSGNFSPVLGHGIALAFVKPDVVIGDDVEVDVRGSRLAGRVVPTPFVGR